VWIFSPPLSPVDSAPVYFCYLYPYVFMVKSGCSGPITRGAGGGSRQHTARTIQRRAGSFLL